MGCLSMGLASEQPVPWAPVTSSQTKSCPLPSFAPGACWFACSGPPASPPPASHSGNPGLLRGSSTLPLVQGVAHIPSDVGSIHLTQRSSQQRSWALGPQFCSPAATILVPSGTWSLCPANGLKTTRLGKRHLQCLSPGKLGSLK